MIQYVILGAMALVLVGVAVFLYHKFKNPFSHLTELELFSRLRLACINEDVVSARQILRLKRISNLNKHTAQSTLLCITSRGGSSEVFKLLIEYGADINATTPKGDTPLICAARNGHTECLEHLLELGIDLNGRGHRGWTALHWASLNGRYEIAEILVAYGANIDLQTEDGGSCVYYGCLSGHVDLVRDMIKYGANIMTVDRRGETPLHAAAKQNGSALRPLLENKAEYRRNAAGETPIDVALLRGHKKFVTLLLEGKPELLNTFHADAVNLAEKHCHDTRDLESIMKVLVELSVTSNLHFQESLKQLVTRVTQIGKCVLLENEKSVSDLATLQNQNVSDDSISTSQNMEARLLTGSQEFVEPTNEEIKVLDVKRQIIENSAQREPFISVFKHFSNTIINLSQEVTRSLKTSEEKAKLSTTTLQLLEPLQGLWSQLEEYILQHISEYDRSNQSESDKSTLSAQLKQVPAMIDRFHSLNLLASNLSFAGSQPDSSNQSENLSTQSDFDHASKLLDTPFFKFVVRVHAALRFLIDNDSNLLTTHLHFVLDLPTTVVQGSADVATSGHSGQSGFADLISRLNFEQKSNWLRIKIESEQSSAKTGSKIEVDRHAQLLTESAKTVLEARPEDIRGKLFVKFVGEQGVGAGVQREWFQLIVKNLLDEKLGLFKIAQDGVSYHPNNDLQTKNVDEAETLFKFLGKVLAMALVHEENLAFKFTAPVYKSLLGKTPSLSDVKSIDETIFKSMEWMLQNEGAEDLGLAFEIVSGNSQNAVVVELKENGSNINVTDSNKKEYVDLAVEHYTQRSIQNALEKIADGFYSVIPRRFISPFSETELSDLISGQIKIDLEDWKLNTVYGNDWNESTEVVVWFWNWMQKQPESLTETGVDNHQCQNIEEKHARVLQFVTGSSTVPLAGFKKLRGVDTRVKFSIVKAPREDGSLPTASTCFNMLKLPAYESSEEFEKRMELAIAEGRLGFSFN